MNIIHKHKITILKSNFHHFYKKYLIKISIFRQFFFQNWAKTAIFKLFKLTYPLNHGANLSLTCFPLKILIFEVWSPEIMTDNILL